MSGIVEGNQEPVFRVFSGPPEETVANVNRSLADYAVTSWTWSTCGDRVILSALLVANKYIRMAQMASLQPPGPQRRQ